MKKALLCVFLTVFAGFLMAAEPLSSIDIKYKNKDGALYAKYDKARTLLNSWRGQQEILAEAYQTLTGITQADSNYAPAYRELGRMYIMAGYINRDNFEPGQLPLSETAILKSIQIEPNYADAYVLLGHLYTVMQRYGEAKGALQKAEMIGTQSPWLHLNWADLLNKQGNQDAAFKRFTTVIDAGTENKKAYGTAIEGVISYYVSHEQYGKADEWYKKDLAYEPSNAWGWGNYASFLLFSRGDVDEAIKNAEKALSIMDYGMGRYILACALYTKWAAILNKDGNIASAQLVFDRAYQTYPDIDSVIAETGQYPRTKDTAVRLTEHKRKASPDYQR